MKNKEKDKLEQIMQDIRDFRDETFCTYSDWQEKLETNPNYNPKEDVNTECSCVFYDMALDKLEEVKNLDLTIPAKHYGS